MAHLQVNLRDMDTRRQGHKSQQGGCAVSEGGRAGSGLSLGPPRQEPCANGPRGMPRGPPSSLGRKEERPGAGQHRGPPAPMATELRSGSGPSSLACSVAEGASRAEDPARPSPRLLPREGAPGKLPKAPSPGSLAEAPASPAQIMAATRLPGHGFLYGNGQASWLSGYSCRLPLGLPRPDPAAGPASLGPPETSDPSGHLP